MKIFIYLLLSSILFTSCFTHKRITKMDNFNAETVAKTVNVKSSLVVTDSIIFDLSKNETASNEDVIISNNKPKVTKTDLTKHNVSKPSGNIKKPSNLVIIDNTDKLKVSEGLIAYSVPTEMKVANKYIIKVRITKDNTDNGKTVLIIGDRHIPINDETVNSKVIIENIRVDKIMTSEILYDSISFRVESLNTKVQDVDSVSYTEWSWVVMPLKSGKGYLKLIVKVKSNNKDIVVFDKAIEVKSNIKYSIKTFVGNYWQWMMTTIIIPLIIFVYKKRKPKRKINR